MSKRETRNYNRADFGTRDDKGHWKPPYPCGYAPLFTEKFKLKNLFTFLFGWDAYLWPRTVLYMALAVGTYFLLKAEIASYSGLTLWFALHMLLRNLAMALIVYGTYHLYLYTFKAEGNHKKYHPDFLHQDKKKFLFNSQLKDNMFRTLAVGVPFWTAYEVLYIALYAGDRIPTTTFSETPIWFVALLLLVPLVRDAHFYWVHKLLHTPWLMKHVHIKHHLNVNPGPWSGMAMHPIETLIYFSSVLLVFVVPAHPIHMFLFMQHAMLTPAFSHTGFEGPLAKGWWPAGQYFHYLHHKHIACNFGGPGVPWDKWFGRFYDGEGKFVFKKIKMIDKDRND